MAVYGRLGSLHVARCPRLNLNKTQHIGIPTYQVNFSRLPRRTVVAGHNNVPQAAQMEAGVVFSTPAGALMCRPLVRRQSMPRQPVKAADGSVGEAAGEQNAGSSMRVWMPVVEESTPWEQKTVVTGVTTAVYSIS